MVYIDVITGFFESGKTTFVQQMLQKNAFMAYKNTVLIACEEGLAEYDEQELKDKNIMLYYVETLQELIDKFSLVEKEIKPDYILVEFNGTWDVNVLLEAEIPRKYKWRNFVFISEAGKYYSYINNMSRLIQPQILNSDVVFFNRAEGLEEKSKKGIRRDVRKINAQTEVVYEDEIDSGYLLNKYFMANHRNIKLGLSFWALLVGLLVLVFMSDTQLVQTFSFFQSMSTIFLGILIEALPFVLIGAIVSASIQIFVPSTWIMDQISKAKIRSFLLAAVAGFFMPVCDCGTVPIVSGLLKKGTPLPQTMTFWLASSAVNPIVLISVYYAFPGKWDLVLIRMLAGLYIAITVGILLHIGKVKTDQVIHNDKITQAVGTDILTVRLSGVPGKIEAIIKGARQEFFRVMQYLILGAFVSAFIQTVVPDKLSGTFGNKVILQLLIMVLAAVVMSTCSTSNAFIGRSFLKYCGIMPIMLYIVLGPMLDFKNMLMLSEVVKKKFLVILSLMIAIIGCIVFYILSLFAWV